MAQGCDLSGGAASNHQRQRSASRSSPTAIETNETEDSRMILVTYPPPAFFSWRKSDRTIESNGPRKFNLEKTGKVKDFVLMINNSFYSLLADLGEVIDDRITRDPATAQVLHRQYQSLKSAIAASELAEKNRQIWLKGAFGAIDDLAVAAGEGPLREVIEELRPYIEARMTLESRLKNWVIISDEDK
jgi:hypothetical protein